MSYVTAAPVDPFEPEPQHRLLARFVGRWAGPTQTWFEPGMAADLGEWEAAGELLLGGRIARIGYRGVLSGHPHAGELTISYDRRGWGISWIDSAHNGRSIMDLRGEPRDDGTIEANGNYWYEGQAWRWKIRLSFPAEGQLLVQHWNAAPDGEPYDAVRTELTRA
jgi:hypothetical protein